MWEPAALNPHGHTKLVLIAENYAQSSSLIKTFKNGQIHNRIIC